MAIRQPIHLACACAAALLAAACAISPAAEPTAGWGTWKLDTERSRFSPGPPPRSLTTRFEPSGDGVKWSSERVGPDGQRSIAQYTARYDGKDYPISGSPGADTISLRRVDSRTTERVNKRNGKVVSVETRRVAADGDSYVTNVTGKTAKGEAIDHMMWFNRQAAH